jgi:hypothetical protein
MSVNEMIEVMCWLNTPAQSQSSEIIPLGFSRDLLCALSIREDLNTCQAFNVILAVPEFESVRRTVFGRFLTHRYCNQFLFPFGGVGDEKILIVFNEEMNNWRQDRGGQFSLLELSNLTKPTPSASFFKSADLKIQPLASEWKVFRAVNQWFAYFGNTRGERRTLISRLEFHTDQQLVTVCRLWTLENVFHNNFQMPLPVYKNRDLLLLTHDRWSDENERVASETNYADIGTFVMGQVKILAVNLTKEAVDCDEPSNDQCKQFSPDSRSISNVFSAAEKGDDIETEFDVRGLIFSKTQLQMVIAVKCGEPGACLVRFRLFDVDWCDGEIYRVHRYQHLPSDHVFSKTNLSNNMHLLAAPYGNDRRIMVTEMQHNPAGHYHQLATRRFHRASFFIELTLENSVRIWLGVNHNSQNISLPRGYLDCLDRLCNVLKIDKAAIGSLFRS